tara:strand:+ start:1630 stop:2337 length:708 start_codon:yes stop_codon:yes gene_type:complete
MKLLFYAEKYQNAIIGTLLIHVLIFVWLNIQSVSFYVLKPKEKTIATIDYRDFKISKTEIKENLKGEKKEIEISNVASNFDQEKPLNSIQKEQLKNEVIKDLEKFEESQFNELKKDNPSLVLNNEKDIKDKKVIINKSVEKKTTAIAKYLVEGRHMVYQKIPSYLCNAYGTVKIDIKVNQKGEVTDCKINSENTDTKNECLLKNALDYTKKWRFNSNFDQNYRVSGWIEFVYLPQ